MIVNHTRQRAIRFDPHPSLFFFVILLLLLEPSSLLAFTQRVSEGRNPYGVHVKL